jgi:hypothetical protein
MSFAGCSDLTGSTQLPAGTNDPSYYNTAVGAQGLYATTVYVVETALQPTIRNSGLLTDELEDPLVGSSSTILQSSSVVMDPLDERILPFGSTAADQPYGDLQAIRGYTGLANAALLAYDTAAADAAKVRAWRSRLALYTGYAETWLADFYCSGVPLSTVDFQKDFTYAGSSTTQQVYRAALMQFDSALALGSDSITLQHAARVGRGRVYLALGQYDSAAAAVQAVPTNFRSQLAVFGYTLAGNYFLNDGATVSDNEGGTGFPYLSRRDPRTASQRVGVSPTGTPLFFPSKYLNNIGSNVGFTPFTLADGIEARLIEAEAALQGHGLTSADTTWLQILNDLRATAPIPGTTQPDTALHALTDPGVTNNGRARVKLLFDERAAWLFMTAHRQGDLRRLIRQYGWAQDDAYPTGVYTAPGTGVYGSDVTMPIPATESQNPKFHGCLDRND